MKEGLGVHTTKPSPAKTQAESELEEARKRLEEIGDRHIGGTTEDICELMGIDPGAIGRIVLETAKQESKEKAVLLALQKGMALIRRDLEIHGMMVDGSTKLIYRGLDYNGLWWGALKALKGAQ